MPPEALGTPVSSAAGEGVTKRLLICLGAIAVAACSAAVIALGDGGAPTGSGTASGRPGPLVATLGDSITAGWPRWDPDPKWRAWLKRNWHRRMTRRSQYQFWANRLQPRLRFRNCGVPGERTDEIALRLDGCARRADVLLIQGGTNDLLQAYKGELPHSPLEQVGVAAANLRGMVREARRAGVRRVLLADVVPIEKTTRAQAAKVRRLHRAIWSIRRHENVQVVPFFHTLTDHGDPARFAAGLNADKVHPSVTGYRRLGGALVGQLR
ncbi:MAG: SGNH/GDSL hydrolase family protein [Solirubrobacterales bacterium]